MTSAMRFSLIYGIAAIMSLATFSVVWRRRDAAGATSLAFMLLAGAFAYHALWPLVLAYFLVLALAAVRFSLGLVWFATLGSMAGYMALVGLTDKSWFDADHSVPPVTQLITVLSLALTGIVLGQVIRRMRSLAEEYSARMAKERAVAP